MERFWRIPYTSNDLLDSLATLLVRLSNMVNRFFDYLPQRRHVDFVETPDIKARLPRIMLSELPHQLLMPLKATHDVDCQVLFSRGEAGQEPITFSSALILVVIATKAYDTGPPHFGFCPGHLLHESHEGETILARFLITDTVEKFLNALVVLSCLSICH